jgi:PAS domain S-box-containing protein
MTRIDASAAATSEGDRSTSISRLSATMHVLILFLGIVVAGFIAFEAIRAMAVTRSIDRIRGASDARLLAAQGAFLAEEVVVTSERVDEIRRIEAGLAPQGRAGSGTPASELSRLEAHEAALRASLTSTADRFQTLHDSLTRGDLESNYGPLKDFMSEGRVEVVEYDGTFGTARSAEDLNTLGSRLGSAMSTVAAAPGFNTTDTQQAVAFLRLNAVDRIAGALNETVRLHREEAGAWQRLFLWISVALIAVAVLGLFTVYCTLVLNFATIGTAKLSIIGLFALIPRVHLETLQAQSRERIAQFDVEEPSEVGDAEDNLRGLGGDGKGAAANTGAAVGSRKRQVARVEMTPVQLSTLAMWDRGGTLEEATSDDRAGGPTESKATEGAAERMTTAGLDAAEAEAALGGGDNPGGDTQSRAASMPGAHQKGVKTTRQASSSDQHATRLRAAGTLAAAAVVMLLMLAAALGVSVEAADATEDMRATLSHKRVSAAVEATLDGRMRELAALAGAYTLSGDLEHLDAYKAIHAEALAQRQERELTLEYSDPAAIAALAALRQLEDNLLRREYIALVLATNGHGRDPSEVEALVRGLRYNMSEVRAAQERTFAEFSAAGVTPASERFPAVDSDIDPTQPREQQLLVARALVHDVIFDALFTLIERARGDHEALVDARVDDARDRIGRLYPAALALLSASLVGLWCGVGMLVSGKSKATPNTAGVLGAWFSAAGLALLANVVVLGLTLWTVDRTRALTDDLASHEALRNISSAALSDGARHPMAFATFGERAPYDKFRAVIDRAALRRALVSMLESDTADKFTPEQRTVVADAATSAMHAVSEALALTEIGVRIAASGFGYTNESYTASGFDAVDSVVYDRSQRRGEAIARSAYDVASEFSNTASDDAKTADERIALAQSTLTSSRFSDARWRAASLIDAALATVEDIVHEQLDNAAGSLGPMLVAAQALTGAAVAILFAAAMVSGFAALQRLTTGRSAGTLDGSNAGRAATQEHVLFGGMTRQVRIALCVIGTVFAAIFAYSIAMTLTAGEKLERLDAAATRSWNVARVGLLSQEALRVSFGGTVQTPVAFPIDARARLLLLSQRVIDERRSFYADFPWPSFSGTEALFGTADTHASLRTRTDAELIAEEALRTDSDVALQPAPGSYSIGWSAVTTDALVLQLVRMASEVGESEPITSASSVDDVNFAVVTRDQIVTLELAATQGLINSTSAVEDRARDLVVTDSAVHYALCCLALLVLGVLLFSVFRPMIARLLFEDDGTRLLLRMIPKSVRSEVPAIQEYLDQGTVTQNEKLQRITEVVTELSTVAFVVIDNVGTVLRFSRAASEEFGYDVDAVVGQNIKMLMPHSIAKGHDGYLRRYRETGVKRVVDRTRRVKGQRKDGSVFPCEIQVKEFRKSARESIFLGFVRDITTTIEFERATKLNEAVSDMAEVPVIVMDRIGTIQRVNRAATEAFLLDAAQIVGSNIKRLMPEEIAVNHDDYLASYQRTKQKKVVDSTRRVTAQRSNGEKFPAQITVREMVDDVGETLFFIGYLRDLTQQLLNDQAALANETVIINSPNPVITINPQGTVQSFSPAAEAAWGFSADEVIGQNIKMLMPVEVAAKHDGYLQRYQKTGEKRIIDTARDLHGRRKDGSLFPAVAYIKELRRGDQVTFIGYLSDLTSQNERLEQARISELSLSASPVPIVITHDDGTIAEFNLAAERFWGHRFEEVVNKNVKMLMPKEVAANHDEYLERYHETGVAAIMGGRRSVGALLKSEAVVECDLNLRETTIDDVKAEGGQRTMYIGFVIETAATRKLEKANLSNNAICDLCTVPMLSIDPEGTLLLFNRAAENTFGYKADEVMGKNIKMLMPEDIAKNHDGYLERYSRTKEKHVIDTIRIARGQRKNGTVFPLELKIREVSKKGVDPIFVGYARDITDDLELRDAKAATDAVLNRSSAPVIVIDIKGTIIRFSAAAERLFRWQESEIAGRNIKVLMPRDVARHHDEYLRNYQRTGVHRITAPREVMAQRRDGHTFPVELTLRETRSTRKTHAMDVPPPPAENAGAKGNLGQTGLAARARADGAKKAKEQDNVVPDDTLFIGYLRDMSMTHVLQRSNEMRDVVLDNATIPMLQIDDMGTLMYGNPAAAREFGYSLDFLMGKNIKMLMPDEIAEKHDGYLETYRRTGVKHIIGSTRRVKGKRKDGSLFPVDASVREIEVDGKRRFVGYVRNITEELRVEDKRNMFGVITDLSTVPMVTMDQIGTIALVNQATVDAFGYSKEELVGANIKLLQPDEVAKEHDAYLRRYRETGVRSVVGTARRIVAKRRNGEHFAAEIMVQESLDKTTNEKTFVGYIRDVTERIRTEVADRIASLTADLSPVPLITMDPRGTVLSFSRAAADEFGYAQSEVIGQNIKMLQPEEIAKEHDRYLKRYADTQVKTVIGTTRKSQAKRKDGTLFPVELSILEVATDGNEPVFVGFVRSLEEELRQADNFRNNMLMVDLLPIPFLAITAEGRVEKINRAGLEHFGYTAEEVLGQNIKMLTPDEIAVNHDEFLARYKKTGVKNVIDSTRDVKAKRKDGTLFPAQISVKETTDELGHSIFFGFLRDVSGEVAAKDQVNIGAAVTSMSIVPLIVLDDFGKILRFSESAESTFGHKSADVVGQNIKMLMPERFSKQHDGFLAAFRTTGKKKVIGSTRAVPAVRADGTEFIMMLRVTSVDNGSGGTTLVGYCEDISGRLRQEKEAAILNVVNDLANVAVIVISELGIIERISRATEVMFGYKAADVVGHNIARLMPREIADVHDKFLLEYQRSKVKSVIDSTRRVTGRREDGTEFPIEIGVSELTQNGVIRFVGFVRDISEEVEREQAVGFSDAIFALSSMPIIIADIKGRIVRCSDAIRDLLGYSSEEVTGSNLKKLMPVDVAANHDGYLKRYVDSGVKHVIDTTRLVQALHKNGSPVVVTISVRELKSADGALFFAGIVDRPDTETERQLEQKEVLRARRRAGEAVDEDGDDAVAPAEQEQPAAPAVAIDAPADVDPVEPDQAAPAPPPA